MPRRVKQTKRSAPKRSHKRYKTGARPQNQPYRFVVRQDVTQSIMPFDKTAWIDFDEAVKSHPILTLYDSYRVKRVGLSVPPGTYMEAVIRDRVNPILTSRRELRNQQDVKVFGRIRPKPAVLWKTPASAIHRGWQDMPTDGSNISTGMHACLCGQSDVDITDVHTTAGIVCSAMIDIEVRFPVVAALTTLIDMTALTIDEPRAPPAPSPILPAGRTGADIWRR